MRFGRKILVCLMFFSAMFFSVTSSADEQGRKVALIKAAAINEMCLAEHRADEILYRRDKPLIMRIAIVGNEFYSKVEDVYSIAGHWTTLYQIGILKPDKAIITHDFERDMKKRFEDASVITDTLTLPADCTPRYDPTTPQKELMISIIVNTVQGRLEDWVKKGIAKYPRNLTLVIADFNVDYQMTYILVEPINHVYKVSLHNPHDYDSDEYERGGWYPFGEQYRPPKSLIKKIRKHGIRKKITLDVPADKGSGPAR